MLCEHRYELYYTLNLGGLRNLIFAQSLKKGFIFLFLHRWKFFSDRNERMGTNFKYSIEKVQIFI